jgi:sec-independent protein translocase protein TatC
MASTKPPASNEPHPANDLPAVERDPKEMSFLDHLEELRVVLFKCLMAFGFGLVVVIAMIGKIADMLTYPLEQAYQMLGSDDINLITTQVFEIFNVLIAVCFLSAIVIALPFMLYFGAKFVAPGLTERELGILKPGCAAAFFLFLVGAAFAFFLVLPNAIFITLKLNEIFNFEQYLRAGSYYATVVWVTFAVGLAFEFPLVLILLAYIEIISVKGMRASRRLAFVIVLVAAALITPGGDPFTLMLLALPLYGLYEVAIMISARIKGVPAPGSEDETETDGDEPGQQPPPPPPSPASPGAADPSADDDIAADDGPDFDDSLYGQEDQELWAEPDADYEDGDLPPRVSEGGASPEDALEEESGSSPEEGEEGEAPEELPEDALEEPEPARAAEEDPAGEPTPEGPEKEVDPTTEPAAGKRGEGEGEDPAGPKNPDIEEEEKRDG